MRDSRSVSPPRLAHALVCAAAALALGAAAPPASKPASGDINQQAIRRSNDPARAADDAQRQPPAGGSLALERVVLATAVVVAAIFALRWIGKRFFGMQMVGGAQQMIRIVGRTNLSPRQQLLLIQVGRRLVLVANSGLQMNPLCEFRDENEISELIGQTTRKAEGGQFDSNLRSASGDFSDDAPAPPSPESSDPALESTRKELGGLMDKVRSLTRVLRK